MPSTKKFLILCVIIMVCHIMALNWYQLTLKVDLAAPQNSLDEDPVDACTCAGEGEVHGFNLEDVISKQIAELEC